MNCYEFESVNVLLSCLLSGDKPAQSSDAIRSWGEQVWQRKVVNRVVSYLELVEETQPGTFGLHSLASVLQNLTISCEREYGDLLALMSQLQDIEILTSIQNFGAWNRIVKLFILYIRSGVFVKERLIRDNYDVGAEVEFKNSLE